ncbi:hypothetical protein CJD36_013810 [Flavipsychrobacter stenotrophus]|uniref:DUF1905 domain-containing protein n=1 Tax=Flavipsychrobacter stenotrophus TaxID=2077091 RepID=A0A2S7SVT4_9BACT|nr:YdeI/OmpD-associated family protein [Flavipsychrobacter stenotrophus]PQJ11040.1 hypothetical protein CJD36_013810 [Flavipsychrobacter stenotrophus]
MANTNKKIEFSTTLLLAKKTATGIEVPAEVVDQLGAGKKPPVKITVNGYTYRSSIAVMGGVYMIGVSAAVREKTGIAGGDKIDVMLELDTEERLVTVHPQFQKALDKDAAANNAFERLSFSKRQSYVLPIGETKNEETRQRRIEKAIIQLKEGK